MSSVFAFTNRFKDFVVAVISQDLLLSIKIGKNNKKIGEKIGKINENREKLELSHDQN